MPRVQAQVDVGSLHPVPQELLLRRLPRHLRPPSRPTHEGNHLREEIELSPTAYFLFPYLHK